MKRNFMLDLLTTMSEDWNEQTAALLDLAIAAMLLKEGKTFTTITHQEMEAVTNNWRIEREVTSDGHWVVTLTRRTETEA